MARIIIFADWLFFDNSEDDANGEVVPIDRRIYRMPIRATKNNWDDVDFLRRFRISKPTFLKVLQLVAPALQHPNPRPRYLTPEEKLLLTLRFMASGSMQSTVADDVCVSTASVSRVLPKVCEALIAHFTTCVRMPETSPMFVCHFSSETGCTV